MTPIDELIRVLLPQLELPDGVRPAYILDRDVVPPQGVAEEVEALRALVRSGGRDDALTGILISSRDVAAYFQPRLGTMRVESFWVVALNAKNQATAIVEVGRGGPSSCPVAIREVLRPLILNGAVSTIVVHNHPSGDPRPSPEDIALTRHLAEACELMSIQLLDHVVVSHDNYASMLDDGLLPARAR
jgi:DNA repair protein RadC